MLISLLILVAVALISLAMPRHHQQVFARHPSVQHTRIMRVIGGLLLLTALLLRVEYQGLGIGFTLFFGEITLWCMVMVSLFTWRTRRQTR